MNLNSKNQEMNKDETSFKSIHLVRNTRHAIKFARVSMWFFALLFATLFMPWTQNIRSNGSMTTYLPQDRPQTIQSLIAGRVEKWYVQEGQFVKKGDTIVRLSEIRERFLDPKLIDRLDDQIKAKESSQSSTSGKVSSLANQISALQKEKVLSLEKARNKVRQAELKLISDSADVRAAVADLEIAKAQARRSDSLLSKGLLPVTEQERRNLKLQESKAKIVSAENKLLSARNELLNAEIELGSIEAEYTNKISKAESELNASLSYMYETQSEIAKLNIEFSNMAIRSGYYFVTAPQDGNVVQAKISGIGETVSEGDVVCSIMPSSPQLAVQLYVQPMDIPLLEKGRKVRIQFDGWPALVFSGWPGTSFGTFGGIVKVIDNFDTQGRYRILVIPDPDDQEWPKQLRVGSGAFGWVMLKDVPIWYELWRQFNGFPPDYLGKQPGTTATEKKSDENKKEK
ncbi:MAG: HlyD family secretion protein [Bacteroidota bacterium]